MGDQGSEVHAYALAFAHWFGLQPQQARVLVTLYRAEGAYRSIPVVGALHGLTRGGLQNIVYELRKALEAEALDYQQPDGYRLTEEGLAECRAALWQMGELLRKAS